MPVTYLVQILAGSFDRADIYQSKISKDSKKGEERGRRRQVRKTGIQEDVWKEGVGRVTQLLNTGPDATCCPEPSL